MLTSISFNLINRVKLSISYVSLKSDNIICVEMSYVLAFLLHRIHYCIVVFEYFFLQIVVD